LDGKGGGRFGPILDVKGENKDLNKVIFIKYPKPEDVEQLKSEPGVSKGPISIKNLEKEGFKVVKRVPYS